MVTGSMRMVRFTIFKIVADCVAGRGNRAYETLKKLLPSNPANNFSKSGVEPYALCNMFFGPENETRSGEAPMHWITGTSSWVFRGITEYLLGVRADFEGLIVDPQIPDVWDGAKITRSYRNAVYEIEIRRGGETGMLIDGKKTQRRIVPVFDDRKIHKVVVVI